MSPHHRRPALLAALVAPVLALSACASTSGDDGKVHALASFYPLQMVLEEVGGDRVDVDSLTPPGAEPHDVELSPAQVAALDAADLVVLQSGFQPSVDDAVAQTSPEHVVDAADRADLDSAATHDDGHAEDGHSDDEHADDEHADDGHDHDGLDPHFWLDPTRLAALAGPVADALSDIDPDGAATYRANADALVDRLTALDEEYAAALASCERRVLVTSHEAFGYLADRYGLEQVGISGIDPEAEPSPARLREVGDVVRDEGVTTIFFETLASPKVAQTLAADLGVEAAVLDPIEGVTDDSQDYFSIAEANLDALRVALSCS
ncbi:zinc ABC transporter substrate-binding protein [Cellulomonas sp. zg-ZUI222]|uniref:Zinc ABC transporter substrate-binding protein n=1 Tax=Cellulomonas wangleii TaxID=2816956 RepID=A0ABX8D2E7_9CELL|nr:MULTISPECIES: metal ABC transporter substrate-binding protein [Cellulomonas]MBO0900016.1 zinc ABC transporter substrate-binding protein [Cellulomonas sp. zg-ZUI22]MBO0921069.1 zinc ABC transporter substrate-binding protein [Cellulomonas wangleii]MBO0925450.1 zinc ABC transporter substrate-binding protein [Cellulomonas wangleii]QVI61075.1 zinc ABC transporter substrate-binding protein [Cellulomonas wangleii]